MIFFKDKLKTLRQRSGLTLEQVGRACGVSQSMVSRWEGKDKSCPRPAKIKKLAALFQCDESELADFEPGEHQSKRITVDEAAERGFRVHGVKLSQEKAIKAFREGLLREIMIAKELDAEAKVVAYNIISKFPAPELEKTENA